MVQTRAQNTSVTDPPVQSTRNVPLTRRRAATDEPAERAAPSTMKGKGKEKAISILSDVSSDDEDDEPEEEVDLPKRNEPIARFHARGLVKSISPPRSESELGSQSLFATQVFANAEYFRRSSVVRQLDAGNLAGHARSSPKGKASDDESQDPTDARELAEIRETALDSLWSTTESLVKLLSAPKPASRAWRTLTGLQRDVWAKIQALYMDRDDLLIDLPNILESLGEGYRTRGRVVMAAANATALLNELLNVSENKRDPLSLLERLDQDFPLPFFIYVPEDPAEVITEEVVNLGLDICTQLLIAQLEEPSRRNDHRSPATFAAPLFCRPLEDDSIDPEEALRHGPHTSICGFAEEYFRDRAHSILNLIEDKPVDEALFALREAYPFYEGEQGGFFGTISQWASGIIEETKDFMRGPSSVRDSSPTDSLASSVQRPTVRHENTNEVMLSRSNVQHLAMLRRSHGGSQETRSPSATPVSQRGTTAESGTGPIHDPDDPRQRSPSLDDDFDAGAIAFARGTQLPRQQQSEAGPSSSAPRPPSRQVSGFTAVNGSNKRPREASSQSQGNEDEEDDEDDPFEQDEREPDPRRREQLDRDRRNMPPPPPRPAKRQRLPSQPRTAPPSSSLAPSSAGLPQSRNPSRALPPGTPASSAPAPTPSPSSTLVGGISFTQIREMNRKVPSARGPGMQQRVPWSDADVRRLIRLIEYHSCVWAKIAKRQEARHRIGDPGPEEMEGCIFDHPRDQQAIRDKARNLKVDLLKGDHPLYPGFDNIALGKKERRTLIERRKNPDRLESDVDDQGDPTNTVYVPTGLDDEMQE